MILIKATEWPKNIKRKTGLSRSKRYVPRMVSLLSVEFYKLIDLSRCFDFFLNVLVYYV